MGSLFCLFTEMCWIQFWRQYLSACIVIVLLLNRWTWQITLKAIKDVFLAYHHNVILFLRLYWRKTSLRHFSINCFSHHPRTTLLKEIHCYCLLTDIENGGKQRRWKKIFRDCPMHGYSNNDNLLTRGKLPCLSLILPKQKAKKYHQFLRPVFSDSWYNIRNFCLPV